MSVTRPVPFFAFLAIEGLAAASGVPLQVVMDEARAVALAEIEKLHS